MKICSCCGEDLDDSQFHRDQKSSDGLASACKRCKKIRRERYYEENPVTGIEWDKKHPDAARNRKRKYRARQADTTH